MLSYWEKTTVATHTDFQIIGAGLTGLMCAWHLRNTHPTAQIRILEAGPFPFGASTRNAGFACFGSPSELLEDIEVYGEQTALKQLEIRFEGLQVYRKLFSDATIDYSPTGGTEVFAASDGVTFKETAEQLSYLNRLVESITGVAPFQIKSDLTATGMNVLSNGFVNTLEGQLHPGKLCEALARALQERGVEIRYGVRVEKWEDSDQSTVAIDQNGISWTSAKMILATNGLTRSLLSQVNIQPGRGQIILTTPIANLPVKGTFHYDRGYWYFRNVGNRLLLGGGRNLDYDGERTANRNTTEFIQEALENMLKEVILPEHEFSIEYRWAGTMAFGDQNEKAPLIEALSDRVVLAARLGGMGVAMAPEIARRAVQLTE